MALERKGRIEEVERQKKPLVDGSEETAFVLARSRGRV